MKNEKKVSIVIPSYKPVFFLQALKSAMGQTYENIEIIVFDNCPSDEIMNMCSIYPNVKYFRNRNVGYLNILNSLYRSTGDFIKPLFDDDILHPFCVQKMVEQAKDSKYSFLFSASQVININNESLGNRVPFNANLEINYKQMTRAMVLNFNNFVGELSTIMIDRNILSLIDPLQLSTYGEYDCKFGLTDVAIYLKLVEKSNAFYVHEILSYFRRDDRYNSNSKQDAIHNPNFKYAVTDWIELLIQSHIKGLVSVLEIKNMNNSIKNLLSMYSGNYPDVMRHQVIFDEYIDKIS